jgi:hypothetical protein
MLRYDLPPPAPPEPPGRSPLRRPLAAVAAWWRRGPRPRRSGAATRRGTAAPRHDAPPGARPTILVYRGDRLAATFVCGRPPVYRGRAGRRVRALVEAARPRANPWTGEVRAGGLAHDSADWFLASVLLGSGLARAGFRVATFGEAGDRPAWLAD